MKSRSLLAWLWTLVIFVLCWLPRMYVPGQEKIPRTFFLLNVDKYVHIGIFLVFAFLWMRSLAGPRRVFWVFLAGILVAVVTELGQNNRFVNRDGNWDDGIADVSGVVLGILADWLISRFQANRQAVKTQSSETP
jgi:VanZ family protein